MPAVPGLVRAPGDVPGVRPPGEVPARIPGRIGEIPGQIPVPDTRVPVPADDEGLLPRLRRRSRELPEMGIVLFLVLLLIPAAVAAALFGSRPR